ncbi:MAG: radical SAM protein [Bauldia sp.]
MKIALISPKGPLYRRRGGIFKKSLRYQPLTLTTLAALAPPELDTEFALYDEGIGDIPLDIDADIIGMTVITGTSTRAYELAAEFRKRGKPVVLGGPHVTLVPDEAQSHADAICVGYAEESWPQLLRDFAAGRMRARYEQGPNFKLTNLPFPQRDLLDGRNYLTQAVFEATRACAHNCEFCVAPAAWGRKQWQKPVAHVVEDIRRVGASKIIFIDLNLISDPAYARELFAALIPTGVRWFGLSTSLVGRDPALMDLMARSGCTGLLIGFESISREGLGTVDKRFNDPQLYASLIRDLHKRGISIQGCFVFGNDADTTETFDATADFAIRTGIDLPRFAILTPFPGTPLHLRLEAQGRILTRNWELYDGQHVVFLPKNMTPSALQIGHERVWKSVYRWRPILARVRRARAQIPLSLAANVGYRFYANHLHTHYTCDWPQAAQPARPACA